MSHHNSKLYKSTLLNETKRVELYRVSEETKKRVEEESKAIRDKMIEANRLSRIRVKKAESKRMKEHEIERKKMIEKWVDMSKHSPFHWDIAQIEENRMKRKNDQAYRKRVDNDRNALIDSMIGTCKFEIANKERARIFDNEPSTQLALSLRRCVKDKQIIYHERTTLDQLLDTELAQMKHKFPNLHFNGIEEFSERLERSSVSTSSNVPSKSPTKTTTTKKSVELNLSQSSIDNSMSGSNSMYHSPQLNPESFGLDLDEAFNC